MGPSCCLADEVAGLVFDLFELGDVAVEFAGVGTD